jgi:membrane protease subunit (stomatin/prohibitin family)
VVVLSCGNFYKLFLNWSYFEGRKYIVFVGPKILIKFRSHISIMGLLRAAMVGRVAGNSARRQMEGMQKQAQAQQAQAQTQAQAAQQGQASAKTDPMQEIAKLGDLKAKGLITEEEFQKMKANVLAKM